MALTGIITKVIGVVIDVEFSGGKVPEIYEALEDELMRSSFDLERFVDLRNLTAREFDVNDHTDHFCNNTCKSHKKKIENYEWGIIHS